jgi:phosphatidylglycerophosphate synthase
VLDAKMRRIIDPLLDPIAAGIARTGASANALTWIGFAVGLAAVPALALEHYGLGLLLLLANRLFDGLDGAVARRTAPTDTGAYLDIVCDFIFYSAIVFGFALARPENAAPAAFLIFSFVGTGSTFLAYAAIAARRGITTEARGRKSIYYLGGLTEGTETILAFILFCLFPARFPLLAAVFGSLCWTTAVFRISFALKTLR